MYNDIYSLLNIIANADQFWSMIQGTPSAHGISIIHVNTVEDSDYLNDLTVPRPTELEYWDV